MYTAHFFNGHSAPVELRGDTLEFKIGVATRDDGYRRVLFFTGKVESEIVEDKWVNHVTRDLP